MAWLREITWPSSPPYSMAKRALVMREAWLDRRKRLEDLLDDRRLPCVAMVPVTNDAAHLYESGWDGR